MSLVAETNSVALGIVTARFVTTCEFFYKLLGFRPVGIEPTHAVLTRSDGVSIELLCSGDRDQPAALQRPTRGEGVWMRLNVDDPDAMHARFVEAGVEIVRPPEYTATGGRTFVARDPNGILLHLTCPGAAPAGGGSTLHRSHHDEHQHHHDQRHRNRVHGLSCH